MSALARLTGRRTVLAAIGGAIAITAAVIVAVLLLTGGGDSVADLIDGSDERLRALTPEQLAAESGLSIGDLTALLEISDTHHWMGLNEIWANNLDGSRHHILHDIEVLHFDAEHRDEMERVLEVHDSAASQEASDIRSLLGQGGQARDMDSVYLYGRLVELATLLERDDWTAHYQEHLDEAQAE